MDYWINEWKDIIRRIIYFEKGEFFIFFLIFYFGTKKNIVPEYWIIPLLFQFYMQFWQFYYIDVKYTFLGCYVSELAWWHTFCWHFYLVTLTLTSLKSKIHVTWFAQEKSIKMPFLTVLASSPKDWSAGKHSIFYSIENMKLWVFS